MALQHERTPVPAPPLARPDDADDLEDAEDEEFEDAQEEDASLSEMGLFTALEDCEVALTRFFNNDLQEARDILKPWAHKSMYHALGSAVLEFIPAILTFDTEQISIASAALKRALQLCQHHRRNKNFVQNSIKTVFNMHQHSSYSDLEAHAELVYAEVLLLQALLNLIEDEDLKALVKGSIKIRTSLALYKQCQKILNKKQWGSLAAREHFESGVRMGVGTFSLMVSLLPARFIALLEMIGFAGDREQGLKDLEEGGRSAGLRRQLCHLTVLTYHLIICHYIGLKGDFYTSEQIITQQLKAHPKGVWYLLFKGRLEFMRGEFDESLATYNRAITSQYEWKQFHHLCYWELMWLHSVRSEWRTASGYAARLHDDSVWSRTTYAYLRAALLLQHAPPPDALDERERRVVDDHVKSAVRYKQRIAGKSLPMEKFAVRRCGRYVAQGGRLVQPGLEMMALWNIFETVANNRDIGHQILAMLSAEIEKYRNNTFPWEAGYEADNRALLHYLEGCVLRHMGCNARAIAAFEDVFRYKNALKEDFFLIPYATVEMAFCLLELGQDETAMQILTDIKKKFSGYSLESRLHFRIHSKLEEQKKKAMQPCAAGTSRRF